MSEDMNRSILVGRCTKDCELTYTQSGIALAKISLAVNRKRKSGDQWVEEVSFFDVTLWAKRAEALAPYLLKGQKIAVDGQLKQDRWEQEGQKRSRVVIEASKIQLLGGQKQSKDNPALHHSGAGIVENPTYGKADPSQSFEDDIPF